MLLRGGIKEDHIVVMMADDIVDNPANPYPGQLFNRPHGPDVYEGVPIVSWTHTYCNPDSAWQEPLPAWCLFGSSGPGREGHNASHR